MKKNLLIQLFVYFFLLVAPLGKTILLNNQTVSQQAKENTTYENQTKTINIDVNHQISLETLGLSQEDLIFTEQSEVAADEVLQTEFLQSNPTFLVYDESKRNWIEYNIILEDKVAPVITLEKETFVFTEGDTINIDQKVSVVDGVDAHPTLTIDQPQVYTLGENKVIYRAIDASGNQSEKTVIVTINKKPEVVAAPATSTYTAPVTESRSVSPTYQANTIYYLGRAVYYANGGYANGENYINSNIYNASTWGGTQTFSGTDGLSTHFIAHNYGGFNYLWNVTNGDIITVTDANGNAFDYRVNAKYKIDRLNPTDEQYNRITTKGGGERIILQTCVDNTGDVLWIIEAEITN